MACLNGWTTSSLFQAQLSEPNPTCTRWTNNTQTHTHARSFLHIHSYTTANAIHPQQWAATAAKGSAHKRHTIHNTYHSLTHCQHGAYVDRCCCTIHRRIHNAVPVATKMCEMCNASWLLSAKAFHQYQKSTLVQRMRMLHNLIPRTELWSRLPREGITQFSRQR